MANVATTRLLQWSLLTHWGRVTHICVGKLSIIGSDNGLSPGRRQAIIWNYAGILSIGLLGTNFSGILIEIHKFSFKKMRLKVSSVKWRPCCLGLNVLNSLAPGRYENNFEIVISEHMLRIKSLISSCEIALRWMQQNTFDNKSTLFKVTVMASFHQISSH